MHTAYNKTKTIQKRQDLDTFLDEVTDPVAEKVCLLHEELRGAYDSGLTLGTLYGVTMYIKRWEYTALTE